MGEPDPRKMKSSLYRIWQQRKALREAQLRPLEESIPDYEEFERGIGAQGFVSSPKKREKKQVSIPDCKELVRGIRGQGFVSSPKKKQVSYQDPYEDQAEECPCPEELERAYDLPQPPALKQRVQDADYDNYYQDSLEAQDAVYDDYYQDPLQNDNAMYDSLEDGAYGELYDSLNLGPVAHGAAEGGTLEDSLEELKTEVDRVINMATAILESHTGGGEEEVEAIEEECPCAEDLEAFRQLEQQRYRRARPRGANAQQQQGFRLHPQRQRNVRYQIPPSNKQDECCCAEDLQAFRMLEQQRQRRARSPATTTRRKFPCNQQQQGFGLQ